MENEKKNKWVELTWAKRIPHGQLCVVSSTNKEGETSYHLARLDRNRDAWVTEPEHTLANGGQFVMLIPEAPGSNYELDKKGGDEYHLYDKLPVAKGYENQ